MTEKSLPTELTPSVPSQSIFRLYQAVVSSMGGILIVAGLTQSVNLDEPLTLALLLILNIGALLTNTFLNGVGFSVASAVTFAIIPLFGPLWAAAIAGISEIVAGMWGGYVRNELFQSAKQISFNMGMNAIAIWVAGLLFQQIVPVDITVPFQILLGWFISAAFYDQLNAWLLIGIVYLQKNVPPLTMWKEMRWAAPLNIFVTAVGGGILTLAVIQFDLLGVAIFFLPIIASAYAFSAYTRAHAKQMAQLETLVKERTQALEDANVALQDLHKEKDAFLAVLTHDMRTPLQSILGYGKFLLDKPDLPVERRLHMAKIILRNQENLAQMVNNILDIEKLQSGNSIDLNRDNFDVVVLLSEIGEILETQALDKAITLHYNLPPHPLIIYADRDKMKRVFTNLVSNALKYTPEGGEVWVKSEMDGEDCLVTVRDTGYGISAEALPTIFERFKRVREHKQMAVGTGLGLAIVKSLTEAHGGTVTVESVVDKGSVFRVKVPA